MHELPLLYAFANENGLTMCDFEGNSFSTKEYEFNGTNAEVIVGENQLVEDIISLINKQKKVNSAIMDLIKAHRKELGKKNRGSR